jgi:hypothetical protein
VTDSLRDLANFVPDAFELVPAVPFTPENTVFGFYTFLPWVRTGIAAAVTAPAGDQIRAQATVHVAVQGAAAPQDVAQTLLVRGPGDVTSINERQIIRRYPERDALKAEDSFLAHVEFDRPDFPWIFSPAAPSGEQLSPWLVLVVVEDDRASLTPGANGLPDQVTTTLAQLQPLDDSWAWAHAQVVGKAADTPSVDDRLTPDYAAVNLSRIICPRRLVAGTRYLACLVPAYDAGVKTALGSPGGTLAPAWVRPPDGSLDGTQVVLPAYSWWRFQTTQESGDFKSLAERLEPVPAPWQVGRRIVDVANPQGGLPTLAADAPGRLQTVHGPIVSPQAPSPTSTDPAEVAGAAAERAAWPASETEALRTALDLPQLLAGNEGALPADQLPLVGPEIYGRNHAGVTTVDPSRDADWLGELNLQPANRIVAGLGTRVVQRDQEQLMQAAWAQVGDVDEANRELRIAQLARFVTSALHRRTLTSLDFGPLLQMTRPLHARVLGDASSTVHALVERSSLASGAATGAFRRATRPTGPLARFAAGGARQALAGLLGRDGDTRDFQRPYRDLDCVGGISDAAARAVDPGIAASALGLETTEPDAVARALVAHGQRLAQTPAVPDVLTPAAVDQARPDPSFDLQHDAGNRLVTLMQQHLDVEQQLENRPPAVHALSLLNSLQNIGGDVRTRALDITQHLRTVENVAPHLQVAPQPVLQRVVRFAAVAAANVTVDALAPIAQDLVQASWPAAPERPQLSLPAVKVLGALEPGATYTSRVLGRLGSLPEWLPRDWFDDQLVQPIMAAPAFTRPMYQALDAWDREWLIPGLARMTEPDLVTVLVSNAVFVEGFLVGLSHAFGRELLWRGYPTDLRGTYFKRFWNAASDELVQEIHRFTQMPLGTHVTPTLAGRLVLLVRGDLIRHYPTAIVLALRAGGTDDTGHPVFIDPSSDPTATAPVLFHDHLPPNMILVGFDLTVDQVRSESWWFVIAEHPTAPRFGLAEDRLDSLSRDTMAWGDLPLRLGFLSASSTAPIPDPSLPSGTAQWGADAATTAHMLLRDPVRAAFDARKLLGPTGVMP